jgi:hypothetical protein
MTSACQGTLQQPYVIEYEWARVKKFSFESVALCGLLIGGLVLRLLGIDFGLPLQLHPDEWSQVEIARGMLSGEMDFIATNCHSW